jgi:hypothetical protein
VAEITYRRARSGNYTEWHYSRRCTKYPSKNYDIAYSEPRSGRICRDCLRIEAKPKVKEW